MTTIGWLRLAASFCGMFAIVFLVRLFGVSGPNDNWPWHLLGLIISCAAIAFLHFAQHRHVSSAAGDRQRR